MPPKVTSQMQHKMVRLHRLECALRRLLVVHISVKGVLIFAKPLNIWDLSVKWFA